MGGAWERQIRTVRKILSSILKDQVTDDERLDTIFCQVEYIVNSRPLTPVSDDPNDLEALTPNHLLLNRSCNLAVPPGIYVKQDIYGRHWRHAQFVAEQFWKRWVKEYLSMIQLRPKWITEITNLAEGDMVLVLDDMLPRMKWPLGRILSVKTSSDGLVRSAEVRTAQGIYVRPTNKLCLVLEHDYSRYCFYR